MSYLFQIGLDFGQQYLTCVYRDLYNEKNESYVYTLNNDNINCLIPNSVIYFNKNFYESNYQSNNGTLLLDIRDAVASISKNKFDDECLQTFMYIFNKKTSTKILSIFVMASCVFLLSRVIYKIRHNIIDNFNDFGKDPDDTILINMSLPYIYCIDDKIKNNFEFLLNKSLELSLRDVLLPYAPILEIASHIFNSPYKNSHLCYIYPSEIASAYTIKLSTIKSNNKKIIYVILSIFNNTIVSYICSYRLKNNTLTIFNYIRNKYSKNIYTEYYKIQNNTDSSKIKEIRNYINLTIRPIILNLIDDHFITTSKFILLYDKTVEKIYKNIVYRDMSSDNSNCMKIEDVIFSINKPIDLKIYSEKQILFNYLHVAYGVSFIYEDLPKFSLSTSIIGRNIKKTSLSKNISRRICPYCHGRNPNCLQCGGFGYTNSIPTSCSSD